MATINFKVDVPAGAIDGYVSAFNATHVSGYTLENNVIFCIEPDIGAAPGVSSYTVLQGIQGTGLSTQQENALEGIFSKYYVAGNTSFQAQEVTVLADWLVVDPTYFIKGLGKTAFAEAKVLAAEGMAGSLTVDPNLTFQTFVNNKGDQSFVNFYDPTSSATPLPPSVGMFMMAIAILFAVSYKKAFAKSH